MPSLEYYNILEWYLGGFCNFDPETEEENTYGSP